MATRIDYSHWHQGMRDTALQLMNYDNSLWQLSATKDSLEPRKVTPNVRFHSALFKVALGAALEYGTKAACFSRKIDILKKPKKRKSDFGPFHNIQAVAEHNTWMAGLLLAHGVKTANDINTKDFGECIDELRNNFAGDTETLKTIDAVDEWREFHRNTDAHVAVKVTQLDLYEEIRPHFNKLISLIVP